MYNQYLSRISITVFAVVFLFLGGSNLASAATFTVTKTADTNDGLCDADCSLREAVFAANSVGSNDTITFAGTVSGTITLSVAFQDILIANAGSLTITGPGANKLTINGGTGTNRIFTSNSAVFSLSGVTLTDGNGSSVFLGSGSGGAVLIGGGTTTFNSVHFLNNTGAALGGALYVSGGTNHLVTNSTFSGNSASNFGAVMADNATTLTITNSTFSGNTTSGVGGASGNVNGSTTTLRNVTIANNNSGGGGGGVFVQGGTLNFGNTIIAGNTSVFPEILFASGTITSAGNNLVGDSAGDSLNTGTPVTYQGSDLQNLSPQLMALGNYGGPTPTRALQFSSPARNNGSDGLAIAAGLTTDQRGPSFLRFVGTVDMGAFEAQDVRFYVTKAANSNDGACNDDCSLREAIALAPNGAVVDFSRDLSGQTLVLGGSEIVINKILSIDGFGASLIEISGGLTSRIFSILGVAVQIEGIKLTNGNGVGTNSGFGGAVFVNGGSLLLDAVDITNNSASSVGGGVFIANSSNSRIGYSTISFNSSASCAGASTFSTTVYLVNSTFSDNIAASVGGALCLDSGSAGTVRNATISGNSASSGGGIAITSSTLNFGNTIVSGNFATGQPEIQNGGAVTSVGNNLVGDSAGDAQNTGTPITYQASDILNVTPGLLPLTIANGGPTPTRALGPASIAVDRGSNALAVDPPSNVPLIVDQRGFTRIVDGNFDGAAVVDIGAYEFASLAPTAAGVSVSGQVTAGKRGVANASITMMDNDGHVLQARSNGFGYFSFDDVPVGATYIVTVTAKGYQFAQQVVTVNDSVTNLSFVAEQP